MRRSKELLVTWANKVKKRALGTWANRVEELEKINSNLAPK